MPKIYRLSLCILAFMLALTLAPISRPCRFASIPLTCHWQDYTAFLGARDGIFGRREPA
ncbi:MAG: hypothetical protein O3C30_03310 [Proteobacteria bacterium]|nr:hypothetical protein [Pseudomonadota bacterium]